MILEGGFGGAFASEFECDGGNDGTSGVGDREGLSARRLDLLNRKGRVGGGGGTSGGNFNAQEIANHSVGNASKPVAVLAKAVSVKAAVQRIESGGNFGKFWFVAKP